MQYDQQFLHHDKAATLADHAVAALQGISRTFNGISNVDTSEQKQALTVTGEDLKQKVSDNFRTALVAVLTNKQDLSTGEKVEAFIAGVVQFVNEGLQKEGTPFFRTWETKVNCHTKLADLEYDYSEFCKQFAVRLSSADFDAIATAAWVEKRFNAEIHPLSDGCGRTSKLLAAFILGREGIALPSFPYRGQYFLEINKSFPEWEQYYRSLIF